MTQKEKAIKGIRWSALENWGNSIISFFVFLLLARLLEPEAFGLVAMAAVFIAFVGMFLDQGFQEAIIQRVDLDEKHLDTAFWANFILGLLMTLSGLVFAKFISALYHEPRLTPIISFLSFTFLLAGLSSTQKAILTRRLDFKRLAIRSLVAAVCGGLVGVVCALKDLGVWSLVYQQLTASVVSVFLLWKISDWRPKLHFSKKHFQDMFSFGLSMVGHKIVNFLDTRSDDFIIAFFLGPIALGYYRVAYRIFEILNNLLIGVISKVAFPVMSALQKEPEKLRHVFNQGAKYISIISLPIYFFIAVLGTELIQAVFGEKWLPSAPIMQILAFAGLLQAILTYNGTLIISMGQPAQLLRIRAISTVATVVSFLLVVKWGIIAVAAAFVGVRYFLLAPMHFKLVSRVSKIKTSTCIIQYHYALTASVIMVIAILCTKLLINDWHNIYGQIFLYIIIGMLTFLISIRVLFPIIYEQLKENFRLFLKEKG